MKLPTEIYVLYELDGSVARVITDEEEVNQIQEGQEGKLGWKRTWTGVRYVAMPMWKDRNGP